MITHKPIYAYPSYSNQKDLSNDGSLGAFVCEYAHFIRTGIPCNGKYGYGGLTAEVGVTVIKSSKKFIAMQKK